MTDLPRPDVEVTSVESDGGHIVDITVSREGHSRKYEGGRDGGFSRDGAVKDAVRKMLDDPYTLEWIPKK